MIRRVQFNAHPNVGKMMVLSFGILKAVTWSKIDATGGGSASC